MVPLVVWVARAAPCLDVAGMWGVAVVGALVPGMMVALLHFYCRSKEANAANERTKATRPLCTSLRFYPLNLASIPRSKFTPPHALPGG